MALFGREHGSKPGSAGVASSAQSNIDRRARLAQLALETIDLDKDPYFMKNHIGSYECRLCQTIHVTPESYLAHTQGRRHQQNMQKRALREARNSGTGYIPAAPQVQVRKTVKIGRPGYKVIKQRDPENNQLGLTFQVEYPEIEENFIPRYRFMSAFEQRVETPDKDYQYLLFAAEPYETIGFKIPNRDIEKNVGPEVPGESKFWTKWDENTKVFSLELNFKPPKKEFIRREKSTYDAMAPKDDPTANYAYFQK